MRPGGGGGMTPGEFDRLDKDEKLDILASYEANWRIEAINQYEANQKMMREAKKSRK